MLGKKVEGVLLGRADKLRVVAALGGGQALQSATPELGFARVDQRANLDEEPVAILERGEDGAGVAAGEEMALERGESPLEVSAKKRFRRLEEFALGDIGRELGDVRLLNR